MSWTKLLCVAYHKYAELLRSLRRRSRFTELCSVRIVQKGMFLNFWRKIGRDGDDWMSDGSEFQRRDAATGNVRRPTVLSRNDGTSSWCDDDEWSRRRPVRRTWVAAPRSLSINTPRSRTALTGQTSEPATENEQLANGQAPRQIRLVGIELKAVRAHPVRDAVDTLWHCIRHRDCNPGIPGSRTVFQSRNPGIMKDQIPGFRY